MKTYIGTKIIKAEPMTYGEFVIKSGKNIGSNVPEDANGYRVVYPDLEGKGCYISWSPKSTFEKAYREIDIKEIDLIRGE